MKKYISILLCFALTVSIMCPVNVYAVDVSPASVVVEAQQTLTELDVTQPITKDTWGEPTIHVDKNSANTTLASWNGQKVEDVEMDLYFRWDKDYLYVGVVSADEHYKKGVMYDGDGIQLRINLGTERTYDSEKSILLTCTYNANEAVVVNANMSTADEKGYKTGIQCIDDVMYVGVAIPLIEFGLSEAEVKAGLAFSYSMIRQSATKDYDYEGHSWEDPHPRSLTGWLAWGIHFEDNGSEASKRALNVNCTTDNVIVLSDKVAQTGTVIRANKAYNDVDLENIKSWGTPAIHVDKNSYNAVLHNYNATAEDTYMDLYLRWDAEYIYIGVISEDKDLRGYKKDYWCGDGIQFGLSDGKTVIANEQLDVCLTFKKKKVEGITLTVDNKRIKDASTDYAHSLTYSEDDKTIQAAVRIPLEDLGFAESDIKAGLALDFSILRISSTTEKEYAGWLAWGAYWGVGNPLTTNKDDNENIVKQCIGDNVIVLSDDVATTATTITSDKATDKVSLNDIKSWGEPAIHVDKNSYNTSLKNYDGGTAEDVYMDIYTTWDGKYLYIGVISNDEDLNGASEYYKGDGLQFGLSKGTVNKARDQFDICLTFDKDVSADAILYVTNNFAKEDEGEDKHPTYAHSLTYSEEDKLFYAAVQIPLEDLEFIEEDIKAGLTLDFSILRLSATKDNPYAGWLAWGAFFGAGHEYNLKSSCDNKIVLIDSNAVNITESEVVDDDFKSLLLNIRESAKTVSSTSGMNLEFGASAAYKIITTANGTYAVYLSRTDEILGKDTGYSAVNEFTLVKIANGEATEIGFGYVYGGLVDLVADNDGNIYIIGGTSSYVMDKVTDKNNGAEKAVLNIFKYNEETGALNGQKQYRAFANKADMHTYLGCAIDGGKIYTVFAGKSADGKYTDIEYFTYDLETSKYDKESGGFAINVANITNSAIFVLEDGIGFICSDGNVIRYFNAKGEETKIDAANLEDIYMDENGNVKILCGETLKVVTINPNGAVSTEVIVSEVASEGYAFRFAQVGTKRYIIATETEAAANVRVYSDEFELISETKLDKLIKCYSSFMVADDFAENAENVTVMFVGTRGKVKDWYTSEVSVLPVEEETPEVSETPEVTE